LEGSEGPTARCPEVDFVKTLLGCQELEPVIVGDCYKRLHSRRFLRRQVLLVSSASLRRIGGEQLSEQPRKRPYRVETIGEVSVFLTQ